MIAPAHHPLKSGVAPAWAVAWGEDLYGAFAAFIVGSSGKQVEQRMRWIPPGAFRMGSPKTEAGQFPNDGPQHWVTLTKGYWLGETPVTQALWGAVMNENPSNFRGEQPDDLQRPVEQVSWDDCHAFLSQLNAQIAGLAAKLPSEAEWERACRGGTQAATWVGDLSGEERAIELDAIAWYRANSGAATHPVGRKVPNPYGLHDMLGNVSEWCQDAAKSWDKLYPYTSKPKIDPVPHNRGMSRVLRGGSWNSNARGSIISYRVALERNVRSFSVGFRLAVGQESTFQ